MLTANVIAIVVGAFVIGGFSKTLFHESEAPYGAMVIAALFAGLVTYAAQTNFNLPDIVAVTVSGKKIFLFWDLLGNFWGALVASFIGGPAVSKGSGVRR